MAAATVITACMSLIMVVFSVMITFYIRIIVKLAGNKSFHRSICIAGNTAKETNTCCCQCHLGATTNTAADQHIRVQCSQNTGQSTMTASIGINNFRSNNFSILYIVQLKLFSMSKMLENIPVFIGNCNSHKMISFRFFI